MAISPLRPKPNAVDKRASRTISQSQLITSMNDKDTFYDLYFTLTDKAIALYTKAGRRKLALRLYGSLAALDVYVKIATS
jgi:trafficking protein particle complex subunit 10